MSRRILSLTFGCAPHLARAGRAGRARLWCWGILALILILLGMLSGQFVREQKVEAQTSGRTVVYVSLQGKDANDGSQARPFLTLQRAVNAVAGLKAEIRIAGGEYNLGDATLRLNGDISLIGGYDPDTWMRDPIITQSVLLPNGFTDTLEDDITDRYKDLRRPPREKKYHETVIKRIWNSFDDLHVLFYGTSARETVIDGVTLYGSNLAPKDDTTKYEATLIWLDKSFVGTIQNSMFLNEYGNTRAYILGELYGGFERIPGGEPRRVKPVLFKNNLIRGGIVTANVKLGNRPQLTFYGDSWFDVTGSLILGTTGGRYTRIVLPWGAGGTWEGNQILGGDSYEESQLALGILRETAALDAVSPVDNVIQNNLIEVDRFGDMGTHSAVFLNNNITTIRAGIAYDVPFFNNGVALVSRKLVFKDNTLHVPPGVNATNFWPTGEDRMTYRLGGTWDFDTGKLIQPAEGPAPTIENNTYLQKEGLYRHKWNVIDLAELGQDIKRIGEEAVLRPESPPTNLTAVNKSDGIHLSWTPSAATNVIGYVVRYGDHPGSYLHPTFVQGTSTVLRFPRGTYYITVSAYKAGKVEGWKISNEVKVVVSEELPPPPPGTNAAPSVTAGADQTITLPASATLDGTVSDDGLPDPPKQVTVSWSKVSGPGTVTFGNAATVDTTASFSAVGTYMLRLSANDSTLSASDDVSVTVNPQGPPPPPGGAGLRGHWKLDEGSGVTASDSSGNNNHGTLTGGPTWTAGRIGGALSFDGTNDWVTSFPNPPSGSVFTVSTWINARSTASVKALYADTNRGWFLKSGILTWYESAYRDATTTLNTDQWYHVAAVANGTSMTFYVNGASDGTSTFNPFLPTHATLGISDPSVETFNGLIDDVCIWDKALSATDIAKLWNSGAGLPCDQLNPPPPPPGDLCLQVRSEVRERLGKDQAFSHVRVVIREEGGAGTTVLEKVYSSNAEGKIVLPAADLTGVQGDGTRTYAVGGKIRLHLRTVLKGQKGFLGKTSCLVMPKSSFGDSDGDGRITVEDLLTFIRFYRDPRDPAFLEVFGGRPSFRKLISAIRSLGRVEE